MQRLITVAAVAVALSAPAGLPRAEATGHAKHYYLSLGDSLAASGQPNGDNTPDVNDVHPTTPGYGVIAEKSSR